MALTREDIFAAMEAAIAADDWRLADRIAREHGFDQMCRECGRDIKDPTQLGHRDSHVMPICWGCDSWNCDFDNPKSYAYESELYYYTGPIEQHFTMSDAIWASIEARRVKKP